MARSGSRMETGEGGAKVPWGGVE